MKIAILGGSFDPPHNGHVLIARQVKELLGVDEVWLIPLFEKNKQDKVFHKMLSPVADRLNMAKLLGNEFIKVSDLEIKHNQSSYTIDTLRLLQKTYPKDTFYWILGSDQLESFQKYYQWQELKKQHLIIFPREHMAIDLTEQVRAALDLQTMPENVIVMNDRNLKVSDISSKEVRKRVRERLSIKDLVPEKVKEYIKKYELYG